ncbi:CHAT domain-containing protein [Solirubrobacter phytolaccae]|uniref:CHAT domain-containing protein n=1 Tax=Solirubrobacter phytolaccae TaxID=1404360 RepID=A0A9X3NDJ7_9ACTN|nr:CHAT domain-containing protein [Solirubrobacter phytolaccae]MDA0182902.1 CHAT domain-containing protein [Solirubrobacter phytolaccae]
MTASRSRVPGRVFILVEIALLILTVTGALEGDLRRTAVAFVAMFVVAQGAVASVVLALVALILGEWPVAIVAAASALTHESLLLLFILRRPTADPAVLASAFALLPPDLHAQLRAVAGDEPISTWHMVALARSEAPELWGRHLGADPGRAAFDGGILADPRGGDCTRFACEAVALADAYVRTADIRLTPDGLAGSAVLVVHSAAHEWVETAVLRDALPLSESQLLAGFQTFGKSAAARGLVTRTELAMKLPPGTDELLPREELAVLTRGRLIRLRFLEAGVWVVVLASMLRDGVRALAWWKRDRRPAPVAPVLARVKPDPVAARTASGGPLEPWYGLPRGFRLLWAVGRPVLAVGAIVAAAVVDDAPVGVVGLTVAVAWLRLLRLPGAAVVLAGGLAVLAPVAGALLVVRAVLAEVVLAAAGGFGDRGCRRRGLERIAVARRHVLDGLDLEGGTYDEAELRLRTAIATNTQERDELWAFAAQLVAAAWAEMRPVTMVRTGLRVVRSAVTGRWSDRAEGIHFGGELQRSYVLDLVVGAGARVLGIVLAALTAAFVVGPAPVGPIDGELLRYAPPMVVAVLLAVLIGRRKVPFVRAAVVAAVAYVAIGPESAGAIAVGIIVGIASHQIRASLERWIVSGPKREPWAPPRRTPRRLRDVWLAADEAAAAFRVPLAIEMLEDLAADPKAAANPSLVADCNARIALWQLEAGQLDDAAKRLDRLGETNHAFTVTGHYAVGMLQVQLGQDALGRDQLALALKQAKARTAQARQIAVALAETHARLDESAEALEVLREHPPPRVVATGLAQMIDRELVVASAMYADKDREAALRRLEDMHLDASPGLELEELDAQTARAVASAQGRAMVLAGRIQLESGRPDRAETKLRDALRRLSTQGDPYWRAVARILLGCSLAERRRFQAAVGEIAAGTEVLEQRRGQLSSTERRMAMIVAGQDVYEQALGALERADEAGVATAGITAAVLVESLRRSAISQMLSERDLSFPREVADRLRGIDVDSNGHADVASEMSAVAAAVFRERAVHPEDLRAVARANGHVLAFNVAPGGATWCVWVSPEGGARVHRVDRPAYGPEHAVSRLRAGRGFSGGELHYPWDDSGPVWQQLADALLPEGLRDRLVMADPDRPERLLIVPDGYVAGVPWAALSVAGSPLAERAVIQLVPAYDLAGSGVWRRRAGRDSVLAHASEPVLDLLRERLSVVRAETRDAFTDGLDAQVHGGAYLGTHGEGTGLQQRVQFPDDRWLSAGGALSHGWPDWVVFAACVIGRIDPRLGGEPLGLPISCMLRGATTVIAAVVRITGASDDDPAPTTVRLYARVGTDLARAQPPAAALRAAQLAYLRSTELPSVADGLGAVCISLLPLRGDLPA